MFVQGRSDETFSDENLHVQPNILDLVDFCKGLAIALVCFFHYKSGWFGWQGVHIFIVLSGFGLTYSCLKKNRNILWRQWYLRRAEKVLPTYWIVILSGFFFSVHHFALQGNSILISLWKSTPQFFLDISLLKAFSYQALWGVKPIIGFGYDHLWFIPLIISFYIFFPFLYRLLTRCEGWYVLLWAAAFEFTYRLISIYWCDGFPIGHEQAFIPGSSLFGPNPLDKLVEGFPFQLQAPFSLFPSRLAEFTLGMIGGISFFNHRFKWIFSIKATLAGFFIWTTGYICVFIDRIGWIFSDFLIALGLILLVVNLARFFQLYLPFLFKKISQLGIWSYYIYLVHKIFIGLFLRLILNSSNVLLGHVMMLLLLVFFTWVASLFLKWIDGSKLLNPFQINR